MLFEAKLEKKISSIKICNDDIYVLLQNRTVQIIDFTGNLKDLLIPPLESKHPILNFSSFKNEIYFTIFNELIVLKD